MENFAFSDVNIELFYPKTSILRATVPISKFRHHSYNLNLPPRGVSTTILTVLHFNYLFLTNRPFFIFTTR